MSFKEELRRGELARHVVENEIYQDAIKQVREGIIKKWEEAPLRDREGHHELKIMLKLLCEITGYIQTTMDTGKMAQIQLEHDRKVTQLRKAGIA